MKVQLSSAVAPDSWSKAVSSTRHSGPGDGVLDRPISQPACVAPVQAFFPGLEELSKGSECRVLLLTGLLGTQEAQVVTSTRVLVGKHHTCVVELIRQPLFCNRKMNVYILCGFVQ